MANLYKFDTTKHKLVITPAGAPIAIGDFAEDVKFSFVYDDDFVTPEMGADGDCTLSEKAYRNATIKLQILSSSPLNTILTGLANSCAVFGLAHTDLNHDTTGGATTPKAFFTKVADKEIGEKAGKREWVIKAIGLVTL